MAQVDKPEIVETQASTGLALVTPDPWGQRVATGISPMLQVNHPANYTYTVIATVSVRGF